MEAALEAVSRSQQERADLAVVFLTSGVHAEGYRVLHAIRRVTGARVLVGCSGAGVLTERMEVEPGTPPVRPERAPGEAPRELPEGEHAVAVLVVRGESVIAAPVLVDGQEGLGAEAGAKVGKEIAPAVAEGGCLLILPDPIGLDPRSLLEGVADALGFLPVLGGVTAGPPFFELVNANLTRGGMASLALSGVEPVIGVAQGCQPIGEPYVITRAEGNVISELGSRPAVDILKEAVLSLDNGETRIRRAGVFAGLAVDPARSPLARGDFLVRNLVSVDRQSGAVAVAGPVRVGQTFQFQIRDAQAAREDLEATLLGVKGRLAGRKPLFGCYFNCVGRGRGLYGVSDHDVTLIARRLGDFPLVGFFGNGEFAPIGRKNLFHNYTGALVIFTGSHPAALTAAG